MHFRTVLTSTLWSDVAPFLFKDTDISSTVILFLIFRRPLYVTLYCGLLCEMAWRHNSIKQTCSIHSKNKDENLHFFMKEWCCFTFQGWVGKKLAYLNSWDQICKYLLNGIRRQTTPISNHVSKADMLAAQVTMFRHCLHFVLQGVLLSHTVYKCDF